MTRLGIRSIAVVHLLVVGGAGCGALPIHSVGGALTITPEVEGFTEHKWTSGDGIYRLDDRRHTVTAVLLQGPPDQPTEAVTIRMFWRPRAGSTPLDKTATNATFQYIVFASDEGAQSVVGREVGVYSGAGFVRPRTKVGRGRLTLGIWQAHLRLVDTSQRLEDLLGKSQLRGEFTVRRADAAVTETLRRLNMLVSDRLGYPRLVSADR